MYSKENGDGSRYSAAVAAAAAALPMTKSRTNDLSVAEGYSPPPQQRSPPRPT